MYSFFLRLLYSSAMSRAAQESKYSRIPVYSGEIDRISGVVLSKDLLAFVQVFIGMCSEFLPHLTYRFSAGKGRGKAIWKTVLNRSRAHGMGPGAHLLPRRRTIEW